jgi:hypothetical protein
MVNKDLVSFSAFYERFSGLEDSRLMEILHNQKDYMETAREAATKIAIERGLIHSEENLYSPEFQNAGRVGFSIFPSLSAGKTRDKLNSSVFRFLYIYSALPIVFGALQFAKGNVNMALAGCSVAIVWMGLVTMAKRWNSAMAFVLLYIMVLTSGIFVGLNMAKTASIGFIDYFILVIAVLLPLYFLALAKKIAASK